MDEEFLKTLIDELSNEEPSRRYSAVIAVGECRRMFDIEPNEDLLNLIIPMLNDEDSHVRYYTAQAIKNLGFKKALPYLEKALKKEGDYVIPDGPNPIFALNDAINQLLMLNNALRK